MHHYLSSQLPLLHRFKHYGNLIINRWDYKSIRGSLPFIIVIIIVIITIVIGGDQESVGVSGLPDFEQRECPVIVGHPT